MNRCTMLALAAGGGVAAYVRWLRPRVQNWNATHEEIRAALPGDDLLPDGPGVRVTTRAVTIEATTAEVWPWLVQMGTNKAGVYTYDWIENLLGMNVHSQDRIVPEHQHLAVGDWNPTTGNKGMRVELVEPERAMAARSPDGTWVWSFILQPLLGGRTRLISRNRYHAPGIAGLAYALPMEPASLIMERKMLHGFRERAERHRVTLPVPLQEEVAAPAGRTAQ